MKFHLNRPLLSITFSLFALFFGIVMIVSTRYLPELQSIRAFFVLFPATLILASLGYILGAMPAQSKNSQSSIIGFLIGGGILITIATAMILPALKL